MKRPQSFSVGPGSGLDCDFDRCDCCSCCNWGFVAGAGVGFPHGDCFSAGANESETGTEAGRYRVARVAGHAPVCAEAIGRVSLGRIWNEGDCPVGEVIVRMCDGEE